MGGIPGVRRSVVASQLTVLPRLQRNLVVRKHLILMMVDHNSTRLLRRGEVIPKAAILERIVDHDRRVPQVPHQLVPVIVEVDQFLQTGQRRGEGLVQQLDGDDDVLVRRHRVFGADGLEHVEGDGDGVALLEARLGDAVARVVEAVLGAGRAVQVDPDFQADLAGPDDALVEVVGGALDIGFVVGEFVCPVCGRFIY